MPARGSKVETKLSLLPALRTGKGLIRHDSFSIDTIVVLPEEDEKNLVERAGDIEAETSSRGVLGHVLQRMCRQILLRMYRYIHAAAVHYSTPDHNLHPPLYH